MYTLINEGRLEDALMPLILSVINGKFLFKSYKDEKPSVWSVRPRRSHNFAVSQCINSGIVRNECHVFWHLQVCFRNFLTTAVRHLRCFECQGVDDSCRNFTYIPAKPQPRHNG